MRMSDWSSDGCSSDLDENASGTVLGRKAQGSFRILAAGDTIFGAFDAVVHGITGEVREGLAETLDHGLVEFGMLAGYFQLHVLAFRGRKVAQNARHTAEHAGDRLRTNGHRAFLAVAGQAFEQRECLVRERKSTRLNSSH